MTGLLSYQLPTPNIHGIPFYSFYTMSFILRPAMTARRTTDNQKHTVREQSGAPSPPPWPCTPKLYILRLGFHGILHRVKGTFFVQTYVLGKLERSATEEHQSLRCNSTTAWLQRLALLEHVNRGRFCPNAQHYIFMVLSRWDQLYGIVLLIFIVLYSLFQY